MIYPRQKTPMLTSKTIDRKWHILDASGKVLGKLANEAAELLIGKHKATHTPHLDGGDYVVVINAEQVVLTGNKEESKIYYRHSGFPGGLRQRTAGELRKALPEKLVEFAVKGMLPKNKLHAPRLRRLKVIVGSEHPYADKVAQE